MRLLAPTIALTLCLLGLVGLCLLGSLTSIPTDPVWRGYTALIVAEEVPWRQALTPVNLESIIAREDVEVAYTSFAGLQTTNLSELDGRFDTLDPRFDPYMRRVGDYFSAGDGWRIVYLRSPQPSFLLRIKLRWAFRHWSGRWQLADNGGILRIPAILVGVVGALALVSFLPDTRRRVVFGIGWLPWVPVLVSGAPDAAVSSILFGAIWVLSVSGFSAWLEDAIVHSRGSVPLHLPPMRGAVPLVVYAGVIVFLIASGLVGRPGALGGALAALGWPISALVPVYGARLRMGVTLHRLFVPVRLMRPWPELRPSLARWLPVAAAMAGAALISALVTVPPRQGDPLSVPAPVAIDETKGILTALEALWERRGASAPPNVAEYLAHVAYQQSLPYGRPYEFPRGPVYLSSYTQEAGRVVRHQSTVLRFDDEWVNQTLAAVPDKSVERILLDQERPVEIRYRSLGKGESALSRLGSWTTPVMILLFSLLVRFSFDSKTETVVTSPEVRRAA